jgi:hypothetical protein
LVNPPSGGRYDRDVLRLPRIPHAPEFVAYVVTTLLALVPVWATPVFPSQDGGSHLYNAHVLGSLLTGDAVPYAHIYRLNFAALANWSDHLVLALLTSVVAPAIAEKLLLSAYVLLYAAAARYAAASIHPDRAWLAHLALPLVFTFSVHMGFYNFILCFPLYFLLIGYYWRHRDGRHAGGLAVVLLALYALHPLAWVFGLLSLTLLVLAAARNVHVHGHTSATTTTRRLLHVWLAGAPGAILLLVLVGHEPTDLVQWQPLPDLVRHIYLGGPLWTFSPADTAFGGAVFALFMTVSVAAWRSAHADDAATALAWTTAVYIALLVLLPSQWKSLGLITERVGTFAFMTWVIALAGQNYSPRVRRIAIACAQVLALLLVVRSTLVVRSLEPYVREYLSVAPHIARERRVLELNFAPRGRDADGDRLVHPVAPFAHTVGLIGASRDAVILNDYEALTSVFPLAQRSDAAARLESTLHDPPDFRLEDLEAYERATCEPIDYIVVWQPDAADAHTREMLDILREHWRLVYVSQPGGYARLWAREPATADCG